MDDNKFDNVLRNKLEDYHHPGIHPGALEAFHLQTPFKNSTNWRQHYRPELLFGSGIALGIILLLLGYLLFMRTARLIHDQTNTINDQRAHIENLKREVSWLKLSKPDTIRITQAGDETRAVTAQLLRQIAILEEKNLELIEANARTNDGRQYPALAPAKQSNTLVDYSSMGSFNLEPAQPKTSHIAKKETKDASASKSLSPATLRAIEKHYHHGVGIKLGPTVDVFGSNYSLGEGHLNFSGGILADFIVSPSLGLETGVKYSERFYAIDDHHLSGSNLPGTDSQLGELQGAEVDYSLLEIPFHLKYRYPLSLRDHLIAGIGYSCLIYLNQDFEYTYEFDNQSHNPTYIVSTATSDGMTVYPGTINISMGISRMLKNKKIIETSLFYNHGISTQGLEATRAQYFGIRGTYWFTVK